MNPYEMLKMESRIPDRNQLLVKAINEQFYRWFVKNDQEIVGEQLNQIALDRSLSLLDIENYLYYRYAEGGAAALVAGVDGIADEELADAILDCIDLNRIAIELEDRYRITKSFVDQF